MNGKIEKTNLVLLSNTRFRPVDVEWVEFDVVAPFSNKKETKVRLRGGKLFIFDSNDKNYRLDTDIIAFVTNPDNWICSKPLSDTTEV